MRTVTLLGLAAEAEAMRLRRIVGVEARIFAWRAAAVAFALAAVLLLHLAAWHALVPMHGAVTTALMLAAADLVVASLLLLVARKGNDPTIEEVAALRSALMRRAVTAAVHAPLASIGATLAHAAVAAVRRD